MKLNKGWKDVEVRGEPFNFGNKICYFPVTRILIIGDFFRYYDHYTDGWNPDIPDDVIEELKFTIYDLNNSSEAFNAIRAVYDHAHHEGQHLISKKLRELANITGP